MDKKFTSDEIPLKQLLGQAKDGRLQLPDFQRGWVWDNDHIASLLTSISLSYPIGAVMTLQTGNPDVQFRPRPLQGAEGLDGVEPELLLLDGQQRSTSLYLALMSRKPVPTRDAKGKQMLRWYYADMRKCIDPDADREDAIISLPADRVSKNFRGETILDLSTREREIDQCMFPLELVLDSSEVMHWQMAFLQSDAGEMAERMETWQSFFHALVQPFDHYQVPTIELAKSTEKEAVCAVFEKVNTGGVSLSVFELLTATFAATNYNLRDDWEQRQQKLGEHDVLSKVDSTQFLQVVTLLATFERRKQHAAANGPDDKAPAVSCKRRDLLRLTLADYERWAEPATQALLRVVPFLHTEHIFRGRDLPYATQLVPLAAIFAVLGDQAESFGVQSMIAKWLWCGVFGEMYGGSTETRFAMDLPDVVDWVAANAEDPRTIREAQFQAERLLTLRTRNAAAYKGIYALQMKRGARDFRTGKTIDVHAYFEDAIDIHHIFPQAWSATNDIPVNHSDCIVNKTPIDQRTNQRIGGQAPSAYLKRIETRDLVEGPLLDELLQSHDIDPLTLRQDDFASFFERRFERLTKLIEAAMGKPVNRQSDGTDNPYASNNHDQESLDALIASGESKIVEFKSTARLNIHTGQRDVAMEWSVLKSVAGFMNSSGGTLLVGVSDDGTPVGIEQDFPFQQKKDRDGWELWLTDALTAALGKSAAAEVSVSFTEQDVATVARIDVGPAAAPVFARKPKGDGKELLLVRINNSTHELSGPEILEYKQQRWG